MTKGELAQKLEQAAKDGTLLTEKHDPDKLASTHPKRRTVIAGELAPKLRDFFASLEFEVTHYENVNYPISSGVWEIKPTNPIFSIPASGVPSNSSTPDSQCDRLIVVSGLQQGLHVFGESHAEIQKRLMAGQLRNPQQLQ